MRKPVLGELCSQSIISRSGPTRPDTATSRMTEDGEDHFKVLASEIDVVVLATEFLLDRLLVVVLLLPTLALLTMMPPNTSVRETDFIPFLCFCSQSCVSEDSAN